MDSFNSMCELLSECRRIKEKKETTKEASVGASLALGCFLKKASPQLGFPNIIPLSFDRAQYLDSYF